jgi:hypothetical protein
VWDAIEQEGILSKSDYFLDGVTPVGGLIPLIPVEEEPDLMKVIDAQPGVSSRPYIIYTWAKVNTGQAWFLKTHHISFFIRSNDGVKMRQLINLFEKYFQDFDEAARRVNDYIIAGPDVFKRFHFKWIEARDLGSQGPAESEGGIQEAMVTLRVTFSDGTGRTF